MLCPACRVALVMSERKGIEIHYCPQCRGVWLDRGELDKIIERSLGEAAPAQAAPPPQYSPQQHGGGHPGGYGYGKPYKRRKSWLEEIFD
jgi:hypothetical protein